MSEVLTLPGMPDTDSTVTVDEAWNRVMRAVEQVGKNQRANLPGQGSFTFRGIDAVLDAVGPALRAHGVTVLPKKIKKIETVEYQSKGGARMINKQITMKWQVRGPAGDTFLGESVGEAADAGDKAIAKAQSVAYRVFLEQALCIPTGERDVNYDNHERASREVESGALNAANEARGDLLTKTQDLGWTGDKLCERFEKDYNQNLLEVLDLEVIRKFGEALILEANDREQAAASARQDLEKEVVATARQATVGSKTTEVGSITDQQLRKLHTLMSKQNIVGHDARVAWCSEALQEPVASTKDLSFDEADTLIQKLEKATQYPPPK